MAVDEFLFLDLVCLNVIAFYGFNDSHHLYVIVLIFSLSF